MDFIEGLNQVLDYVEKHLEVTENDGLSLEKLAKIIEQFNRCWGGAFADYLTWIYKSNIFTSTNWCIKYIW